jgi:hypothetical protein
MLGTLIAGLGGLFSSSKVQDLAIDGLRKVGGLNDMTPKEKSEYILRYMDATRHQSPVRRLIAFSLTGFYILILTTWLIAAGVGFMAHTPAALSFAGELRGFIAEVLTQPFNIILAFYFVTNIAGKFGGK